MTSFGMCEAINVRGEINYRWAENSGSTDYRVGEQADCVFEERRKASGLELHTEHTPMAPRGRVNLPWSLRRRLIAGLVFA